MDKRIDKSKTVFLGVLISKENHAALLAYCAKIGRKRSAVVREFIAEGLKKAENEGNDAV
jgi:hypothetical protein